MSSEHNKQRKACIEGAALIGWFPGKTNRNGYTEMRCSCPDKHMTWLHKTPRLRNHFQYKLQEMRRTCRVEPDA